MVLPLFSMMSGTAVTMASSALDWWHGSTAKPARYRQVNPCRAGDAVHLPSGCWQTVRMSALPLTSRDACSGVEAALHEPCVLLKLGEIVLKGKNRQQFERLLADNIRRAIRDLGFPVQLRQREGVIVLTLATGQPPGAARAGAGQPGGG